MYQALGMTWTLVKMSLPPLAGQKIISAVSINWIFELICRREEGEERKIICRPRGLINLASALTCDISNKANNDSALRDSKPRVLRTV